MENNVQSRTLKKGSGKVFPIILLALAIMASFATIFFHYLNYFIYTINYPSLFDDIYMHINNLTRSGIVNSLAALFLPAALLAALYTNKKGFAVVLLIVGIGVLAIQTITGIVCVAAQFIEIPTDLLSLTSWIFGSRFLPQLVDLLRFIPQIIRLGFTERILLYTIRATSLLVKEGLFLFETLLCVICAVIMVLKKKRV